MNPDPSKSYLFLFIKTDEFNTKVEISTPFTQKTGEVLVEPKTQDRGQCINPALLAPKPPSQQQGSSPMGGHTIVHSPSRGEGRLGQGTLLHQTWANKAAGRVE